MTLDHPSTSPEPQIATLEPPEAPEPSVTPSKFSTLTWRDFATRNIRRHEAVSWLPRRPEIVLDARRTHRTYIHRRLGLHWVPSERVAGHKFVRYGLIIDTAFASIYQHFRSSDAHRRLRGAPQGAGRP